MGRRHTSMKKTVAYMLRCVICGAILATLASCRMQASPEATPTRTEAELAHDTSNYEPQAGDRVRLTGVLKTTKGYMGVVKGILLPHFLNRDEEALKYKDKWVSVVGTLSKRTYPEGKDVQRWLGLELEMESIEIVAAEGEQQETAEKLSTGR